MNSNGITRASSEGLKLAGPGGRSILLKAGSTETQGAYSLLKFTAPAGSPCSTHHVHTATEAWYVLDGELTFRLGETTLPAPAGSFVLAPGGTPHSQVNARGGLQA
jgi:mannose-6-phosphate isomerase-like protein (cupin superfamily)